MCDVKVRELRHLQSSPWSLKFDSQKWTLVALKHGVFAYNGKCFCILSTRRFNTVHTSDIRSVGEVSAHRVVMCGSHSDFAVVNYETGTFFSIKVSEWVHEVSTSPSTSWILLDKWNGLHAMDINEPHKGVIKYKHYLRKPCRTFCFGCQKND